MVALEHPTQPVGHTRARHRAAASPWLLGTLVVLVLGTLAPLAIAPGVGRLSATVLTLLLGIGAASVGLALGSSRAAFWLTCGLVLVASVGGLAPRPGPGYEEPEALWQTDQRISVSVPAQPSSALNVLAEPVIGRSQAPFGLTATLNNERALSWRCPFPAGVQWLRLPLDAPVSSGGTLEVQLGLTGNPDREQNYLLVYHASRRDGYLVGLAPDPAVSAPMTTCAAA